MTGTTQRRVAAVIVAAGRGERFGNSDKILTPVSGRPMLAWSLDAFDVAISVRDIVIVTGEHTQDAIAELVATGPWQRVCAIVSGGDRRQDSVRAGVAAVAPDLDLVLVHDAARPLITADQIERCVASVAIHRAAILAEPLADTLKLVKYSRVSQTVPRDDMWAAQTPQGFFRAELLDAIQHAHAADIEFTDEAALYEALARPVVIVPADAPNMKVTRPADIDLVSLVLNYRIATR